MKKLNPTILTEEIAKSIPRDEALRARESLAPTRRIKVATHVKKGMASVNLLEGLAVPSGTGGLWTVPLFERFPHLLDVLGFGVQAKPVVMMIDLSGFSSGTANLTADDIRAILDPYYEKVVQEVETAGGVVEKFIGDAVIALLGHPFRSEAAKDQLTLKSDIQSAVELCKRCIQWSHKQFSGKMTAKAAVTFGELFIGWVGPESYSDLTVIGRPMTELFRLEEKAPNGGVILPKWLFEGNVREATNWVPSGQAAPWSHSEEAAVELRGLGTLDVTKLIYTPR